MAWPLPSSWIKPPTQTNRLDRRHHLKRRFQPRMQGPTRRITIINGAWVVLGVYLGCVMCKNASSLHSPHWCLVTGYLHLALCYFKQHHLVPLMTGLRKKPCILWCQNWVCLEIRWISCWLDVDFQYFDCCLVVYYAFKTSAKYEWIFINIPSCLYRSSPHVHACLCVYIYIPFQHSNLKM